MCCQPDSTGFCNQVSHIPPAIGATSNNLQTNWCFTGSSIGGGNSGSSGSTAVCP